MAPVRPLPATMQELAALTGGQLLNADPTLTITGISSVDLAGPTEITWISDQKYTARLEQSRAGAVMIDAKQAETRVPAIVVGDPQIAVSKLLSRFEIPIERPSPGIHPTAIIAEYAEIDPTAAIGPHVCVGTGARVGPNTTIHAGCFIGAGATIGADCNIWPHVHISDRSQIGNRVIIKPGAVIGTPGFGFIFRDGGHRRVPQIGIVILEDDVEIGANSCVDRAKFGITRIGRGTKIDNLVQIAHNCIVGPHCIIVSGVGMSGSVTTGAGVIVAGHVGLVEDISIANGVNIGAKSLVTKDLTKPGGRYFGSPARDSMEEQRSQAANRRVPELLKTVKELTRRIEQLERERLA